MNEETRIVANQRMVTATLFSLQQPVDELVTTALSAEARAEIINTSNFRPSQDEMIGRWFARTLSIREELWQIIANASESLGKEINAIKNQDDWRWLLIGYSAACMLVRIDRFILQDFAKHKTIQRKLNESFHEYRIPKKCFTKIFSHYTDPMLALNLYEVMRFVAKNRNMVARMQSDPVVGTLAKNLNEYESWLDPSKRNFVRRTIEYFRHAWRRRAASAKQKTFATVMEGLGRAVSEVSIKTGKKVRTKHRNEIKALLQPGDVLVTRHLHALTNLFLPGTWPHTALYVGDAAERQTLDIQAKERINKLWQDDICTFEALKDGVRLRSLEETLNVDGFIVIRPNLSSAGIKTGIERVLMHAGKYYNFDFDFFRSDRLVCTEVIYRAFDGIEDLKFNLVERAGRQTLAAEDFLDMALHTDMFTPVAIFNTEQTGTKIISDRTTASLVRSSYRAE